MDHQNLWFKDPQLIRVKKILPLCRSILQPKSQNWSRKFRAEKNWVNKNFNKIRSKTTRPEIFEIENITENLKWSIKFGPKKIGLKKKCWTKKSCQQKCWTKKIGRKI